MLLNQVSAWILICYFYILSRPVSLDKRFVICGTLRWWFCILFGLSFNESNGIWLANCNLILGSNSSLLLIQVSADKRSDTGAEIFGQSEQLGKTSSKKKRKETPLLRPVRPVNFMCLFHDLLCLFDTHGLTSCAGDMHLQWPICPCLETIASSGKVSNFIVNFPCNILLLSFRLDNRMWLLITFLLNSNWCQICWKQWPDTVVMLIRSVLNLRIWHHIHFWFLILWINECG